MPSRFQRGIPPPSTFGNPPPELPLSPLRWVRTLWAIPDERLIAMLGADAYMYLRFLRLGCEVRVCCVCPYAKSCGGHPRAAHRL
jgi:hypothetical protein